LITRRHWDHINGLPIFEPLFDPLFDPRTRYRVYGGPEDQTGRSIEHVLAVQFQKSYFPIFEAQLAAGPDFRRLTEAETFDIADARVSTVLMNHPTPNFGYRIECSGRSLFFTGNHEPFGNPHPVNTSGFVEHQVWIDQRSATIDGAQKHRRSDLGVHLYRG